MTPEEAAALRSEVVEKCSAELVAARDTQAIADTVNVDRVKSIEVPAYTVRGAIYAMGRMPAFLIKANAARAGTDISDAAMACQALYDLSLAGQVIPMDNDAIASRVAIDLDLMVTDGILEPQHKAEILALVRVPDHVSELDVRRVCWSDDGDWLL